MPFYLANPRTTAHTGSVQRGSMIVSDYVRTEPGRFLYKFATGYSRPFATMVLSNLPAVVRALRDPGRSVPYDGSHYTYAPYDTTRIPFVLLPQLQVQFQGRPREDFLETITASGGEARRIRGQNRDTWCIPLDDYEKAAEMIDLGGIDDSFSPTEGAISVPMIESTILLITRIAAVAAVLEVVSTHNSSRVSLEFSTDIVVTPDVVEEGPGPRDEDVPMTNRGPQTRTVTMTYGLNDPVPLTINVRPSLQAIPEPMVTVDNADTTHGGIFVAYEDAYTGFCLESLQRFLNAFKGVCFESNDAADHSDVLKHWRSGISRTTTGRYLAHMMMLCVIAKEMCTSVQFIMRPDGKYEGGILKGEDIGIAPAFGRWYMGISAAELIVDMEECASHNKTVRKILEAVGLVAVQPEQFQTLRALSQAVNASGTPSGAAMNVINKLLPGVDFLEKPEPVNTDTIIRCIQLFSTDSVIPRELYMDKGAFFTTDRYVEVLSCFGTSAPSFNWSGPSTIRCCDIIGKGSAADSTYSTEPPARLSSKQVLLAQCAAQWKTVMQRGILSGSFDKVDKNGREYKGDQKTKLWRALDDRIRLTIIPRGQGANVISDAAASTGVKRTLPDQDAVDERAARKRRLFG